MKLKMGTIEKIIDEYKKHIEYIDLHSTPREGLTPLSEIDSSVVNNPYRSKLEELINGLTPDERAELKAIMWLGRRFETADFETLKRQAIKMADSGDADYIISKKDLDHLLVNGIEKIKAK